MDILNSESTIFTDREKTAMIKRLNNNYKDPDGAFSKTRKKIQEIILWNKNPIMRKGLNVLLKQKVKTRKIVKAKPNEEKSFEDFKKDIGY